MTTMRAQLAPALLLLLILLAAAVPLVPALAPQEIRDRKINGANKLYIMSADPEAYAGDKKSTPDTKKDVVQKTSYVMGAGAEPKPESKKDEKVLEAKISAEVKKMRKQAADDAARAEPEPESKKDEKVLEAKISAEVKKMRKQAAEDAARTEPKPESKKDEKVLEAKISAEVKEMRKQAADDDAVAEKNAKELKSKPKNTTDDAEDQAKSKGESYEDAALKKESKSKVDYSVDTDGEKKPKNKDEEKKSKIKSEDSSDDEKKSKSKDDDDEKKEKKSKSKEEDSTSTGDSEKKSKIKADAYQFPGAEKKSKEKSESSEDKKKSKSKNKEEDFDAVPIESKADESVPAADTSGGYQAPTTTTMSAADTPDGYAAPTTMSAADTPDGYVTPSKAQPAMSAADTPDGYVPATDSPDGNVPASDSPDGYAAPSTKPKVTVQSFSEMVPQSVLQMLSPMVKSMCGQTSYPTMCETSIAKLPETTVVPARQKDGLGVLTLAVDAVRAKIAEAKNAAMDLSSNAATDKITKSAISDCLQLYDDINTSYDSALAALKRGDRPTATSALDAARTYVDTCDQGFLDRPALKPVMAGQEKVLAQLASNVLAINKFM